MATILDFSLVIEPMCMNWKKSVTKPLENVIFVKYPRLHTEKNRMKMVTISTFCQKVLLTGLNVLLYHTFC